MHSAPSRPTRPPVPALIATVLLAIAPVRLAYIAVTEVLDAEPWAVVPVVFCGLWALLVFGLWRGWRAAYVVAVVIAVLNTVSELAAGAAAVSPGADRVVDVTRVEDGVLTAAGLAASVLVLLLLVFSPRSRAYYARP
ncbi:hypothetical protein [Cryptosporangium aurantiacum]|uniref:Uncharacterized protein n=1 Tax=Cryptosporangium aurantiacum TaxID=134849 RepID=A0A1M7R1C1_9ACTN|nr:hypothetical protein [Cryptosporangium aurantiacum]SHN38578.1 hypothetical protein SAMN05443668_106100 [Cryptosporangium aurantiacum]